jgi:hypothetical protein
LAKHEDKNNIQTTKGGAFYFRQEIEPRHFEVGLLPSGKLTYLWKITIFIGKTHYKSPFSIAMLVYQRVQQFIWTLDKAYTVAAKAFSI